MNIQKNATYKTVMAAVILFCIHSEHAMQAAGMSYKQAVEEKIFKQAAKAYNIIKANKETVAKLFNKPGYTDEASKETFKIIVNAYNTLRSNFDSLAKNAPEVRNRIQTLKERYPAPPLSTEKPLLPQLIERSLNAKRTLFKVANEIDAYGQSTNQISTKMEAIRKFLREPYKALNQTELQGLLKKALQEQQAKFRRTEAPSPASNTILREFDAMIAEAEESERRRTAEEAREEARAAYHQKRQRREHGRQARKVGYRKPALVEGITELVEWE